MYEKIEVYAKSIDGVKIYRVLKNFKTGLYYVQSLDYLYPPFEQAKIRQHEKRFFELFFEEDISLRVEGFCDVETAIKFFDESFESFD